MSPDILSFMIGPDAVLYGKSSWNMARAIEQFKSGKARIFVTSLTSGYDVGDKVGNDVRELILLPTFADRRPNDQKNIIGRVHGRIDNRSNPIITHLHLDGEDAVFETYELPNIER